MDVLSSRCWRWRAMNLKACCWRNRTASVESNRSRCVCVCLFEEKFAYWRCFFLLSFNCLFPNLKNFVVSYFRHAARSTTRVSLFEARQRYATLAAGLYRRKLGEFFYSDYWKHTNISTLRYELVFCVFIFVVVL